MYANFSKLMIKIKDFYIFLIENNYL